MNVVECTAFRLKGNVLADFVDVVRRYERESTISEIRASKLLAIPFLEEMFMKRIVPFFVLLFLAACGAAELDTAVTPSATGQPQIGTVTETADTAVSATSFTPASSVAEAALLRNHDHTHGAAEPVVTIIEYGDFQ